MEPSHIPAWIRLPLRPITWTTLIRPLHAKGVLRRHSVERTATGLGNSGHGGESVLHSFITKHLSQSEEFKLGWRKYTLAADGGLIYAMYQNGRVQRHVVCNPVSRDFHHIKESNPFWIRDVVTMSVDTATRSYRIATMESYDRYYTTSRRGRVYLYDSNTMAWRILREVPGDEYRGCSSVFMEGNLYILFSDPASSCLRLYSCDIEPGALRSIDVEFPGSRSFKRPLELVVSLGRLFYVAYRRRPSTTLTALEAVHVGKEVVIDGKTFYVSDALDEPWEEIQQRVKVRVRRILLVEKEVVKVATRAMSLTIPRKTLEGRLEVVVGDVLAFGCADSIVISSLAHSMMFRKTPGTCRTQIWKIKTVQVFALACCILT